MQVKCANSERGCQWTGTVGTLDHHIASCQFALVPCPNKCEEDKGAGELLLIRKHLDQHLKTKCPKRANECPHCGEKGTFASITEDHDQVCEKKIVACPNKRSGCWKTKEHVSSDCEYTEVACVYESLGCGVRMPRKDRERHEKEDREKHLDFSLATVRSLSKQLKTLSDTVNLHEEQHKILSEREAVVFHLPGYASKKEKNETFHSTPFYTQPGGYKMRIIIDARGVYDGKGTHVSVFPELLEGHYDNKLYWLFLGTVTLELLNQLGDNNHHKSDIVYDASDDMRVESNCGYPKFFPHSSLGHNPATSTQYLLDDTLYFRVSVKEGNHKPWLVCADKVTIDSIRAATNNYKTLKNNESMIFKVAKYQEKIISELRDTSNSFYTHPGGYKMCILTYLNGHGDGEGTHVSVFTKLLEGCYDNHLHWPFLGTVTVELLNQLKDDNHHKTDIPYDASDDMIVGSSVGYPEFVSHSYLATNTQYLLDDTLYFRVSVKLENHKPWLVCTRHS